MPVPLAAKAGVIAVTVAVAAAIAVYESPELRRMADDLRRRIAIALHSLGDGVNPPSREPLFNRPEDAEGFLQSRGAEPGVDADDVTRRRQREELMFWNAQLMAKQQKERSMAENAVSRKRSSTRGSSFDDFLREDQSAEKGTFVYNTGTDIRDDDEGLIRRRGADGFRGLNSSIYTNPFADEHGIDFEDHSEMMPNLLSPGQDEIMTDIYNATPRDGRSQVAASQTLSPQPISTTVLFDADESHPDSHVDNTLSGTLERELGPDEYMTAGQDQHQDAYASIQAWAQTSNPSFYSPLPVSPPAPLSEPDIISDGALTPTDSASLAGSGEDIGHDARSSVAGDHGRYYDVLSESEDGYPTPASWSEVGSVVSESDGGAVHAV